MGTVYHKYLGRDEAPPPEAKVRGDGQSAKEKLDAEWRRKRIDAESARQRLHEAKLLAMKGELIPRQLVQRQASFLVLSLRARLLALSPMHARELAAITDERELQLRLDAIVRSALDEIAEMPLKVTDPNWMQKLDGNEWTPSVKKSSSKAKSKS